MAAEDHARVCSFVTQCLHNVIFLCNQLLPQASDQSVSSQVPHGSPDTTAKSVEAPGSSSSGLPNPSGGLPCPSNGHRGRLGSTKEGSAAEAAEQLAMLSLDRSRASSGEPDMSRYVCVCIYIHTYMTIHICVYMCQYTGVGVSAYICARLYVLA